MKQQLLGLAVAVALVATTAGVAVAKTEVKAGYSGASGGLKDAGTAGSAAGVRDHGPKGNGGSVGMKDEHGPKGNGGSVGMKDAHGPKGGGNVNKGTKKGRAAARKPKSAAGVRGGLKDQGTFDKGGVSAGAHDGHGPKGRSGGKGG